MSGPGSASGSAGRASRAGGRHFRCRGRSGGRRRRGGCSRGWRRRGGCCGRCRGRSRRGRRHVAHCAPRMPDVHASVTPSGTALGPRVSRKRARARACRGAGARRIGRRRALRRATGREQQERRRGGEPPILHLAPPKLIGTRGGSADAAVRAPTYSVRVPSRSNRYACIAELLPVRKREGGG